MQPQVVNHRGNGATKRRPRRPLPRLVHPNDMLESGTIKWYDHNRRFGFIIDDQGGGDVFLHQSVVLQYGIREHDLQKGCPVLFVIDDARPGYRPEASAIAVG